MPSRFDTIVLGLGAMGSAAFYHLARAGKSVLGLDQFNPPHSQGSSHGDTRIIRRNTYAPEVYVPLANRAYELWEQLERDTKTELLRVTGGLMIGSQDSAVITRSLDCHKNWGVAGTVLSRAETLRRFPQFALPQDHVAFFEDGAGYLLLDRCIQAHCSAGAQAGGEIHTNEAALSWKAEDGGQGVTVRTSQAEYLADSLVISAGAWTSSLIPELAPAIRTERQILHWYEPLVPLANFSAPAFPIYIWDLDTGTCFYGFPHCPEGQSGVKLAVESVNEICTPESINRAVSQAETKRVTEVLKTYMPGLAGECVGVATCMYSPTTDNNFIISRHPSAPQVVVLAGFLGAGFKFSSVVGEAAKDLIIDGKSRLAAPELSAGRF